MKRNGRKALIFAAAAVAVILAGVRLLDDFMDRTAWERAADIVYPMTNQNITWTGAGYSGIYGGRGQ